MSENCTRIDTLIYYLPNFLLSLLIPSIPKRVRKINSISFQVGTQVRVSFQKLVLDSKTTFTFNLPSMKRLILIFMIIVSRNIHRLRILFLPTYSCQKKVSWINERTSISEHAPLQRCNNAKVSYWKQSFLTLIILTSAFPRKLK